MSEIPKPMDSVVNCEYVLVNYINFGCCHPYVQGLHKP
jgi:hypothetical protein